MRQKIIKSSEEHF
jgi:hypothetical protein